MSKLLRPNNLSSYLPLPQNSHIDDDNDPGKETVQSFRDQGKRRLLSPWFQLAIIVVLLLLAGIAGFLIGLSHPQSRLRFSSFPETVPQGSFSSGTSRRRHADRASSSVHRFIQEDVPIQRKLCGSSTPRRRSRASLGFFDPQ